MYNIPINLKKAYETEGKEVIKAFEKAILLLVIDDEWKEHLREMDDLRDSVQNASYEQKDPLLIYKLESFTMGRIYDYNVNYSKYLVLRKERREQQQKQWEEQQKMIAETQEFIERFKGTYSKTLQVQSRVKMLEKLELVEVDEEDTSALRLRFPPSPRSGSYPVTCEGVGKSYDDHGTMALRLD